jgi:hypothetical protein
MTRISHEPDHFGGWVMVKAPENEPEALLAALKRGDFYSSQGPDGVHGASMTRAEIRLRGRRATPWLRVVVVDAAGRMAWTNPVWLD